MFAEPQTIVLTGHGTPSLNRVPSPNPKIGLFSTADGTVQLSFHQNASNNRFDRQARLTVRKVAADPITAVNKEVSASVVVTINEPKFGFDDTELLNMFGSLAAEMSENSYDKIARLLGGEL
jgi:hypothetical protein